MIPTVVMGAALVAAGGALGLRRVRAGLALQIAGAAVLAAGAIAILASGEHVGAGFSDGFAPAFGLDGLSAFFLAVIALTAIPALLTACDAPRMGPALTALTAAFVLSLAGLVAARDVTSLLAFWELMTLVPAIAILLERRDAEARRVVFVYLAIAHLGGTGVWVALLALAADGWHSGSALVAVAALVGFGTKAGLVPLHAWLPRAHPIAPAHISALMSGVMTKAALYGLIRVLFEWTAPAPLWVGLALAALGALSALTGIVYALVQRELKRLLAFSTIENVGVVALGLGASAVLAAAGDQRWSALAFGAALLHVANHAAFKSLLFLGAGVFADAAGVLRLDRLGGLLRTMPWTGWAFLVGCAAIAGLPPLNGFASEWLTLQSLLHVVYAPPAGVSAAGAAGLAALAATAALAVYCFVKVIGLVLLGEPRTPAAAEAADPPRATRLGLMLPAAACVLLGAFATRLLEPLARLAPGDVELGGELPGTGSFAPFALLAALVLLVAVLRRASAGAGRAAVAPAWACGQQAVPRLRWTSAGFTKPLRLVLERALRPRRDVDVRERGGVVVGVRYEQEVPHLFDTALYRPAQRGALRAAAVARRLQSGSLRAYVAYLLALVFVLLVLARIGGAP